MDERAPGEGSGHVRPAGTERSDVAPPITAQRPNPAINHQPNFRDRFDRVAERATQALGSMPALVGSVVLVVVWALTGPVFGFSDTWQLFINTTTTVITFWMVFVIQNSANRQSKAVSLKLDELLRAVAEARNEFMAVDDEPETLLDERRKEFTDLADPSIPDPDDPTPSRPSGASREDAP